MKKVNSYKVVRFIEFGVDDVNPGCRAAEEKSEYGSDLGKLVEKKRKST